MTARWHRCAHRHLTASGYLGSTTKHVSWWRWLLRLGGPA